MPSPTKLVVALFLVASSLMISARKLESGSSLAARLKVAEEGPTSTCWDALLELQSCSREMVMFFLNGETQLGANCCTAIKVIEHHCWPSMLGALGITAEESGILRGYCDADGGGGGAPPPDSTLELCYSFPRLQH